LTTCFIVEHDLYLSLAQSLEDPNSLIEHYIILRGIERFYSEYYTYPGKIDEQVEHDFPKLKVDTRIISLSITFYNTLHIFSYAYQIY